jgi:putative SOS response-associated peptidase YedK
MLRWGLVPFRAGDRRIGYATINARGEDLPTRLAFRESFKSRRCLVPANGFYGWARLDATTKQPYRIGMADDGVFAFAGLWARWNDKISGQLVRSFCIVTTPPNELCAQSRDRMPMILDRDDYARWLGEATASLEELHRLIRPFPAERMRAHKVGQRVGNPRNDDPQLIEPLVEAAS